MLGSDTPYSFHVMHVSQNKEESNQSVVNLRFTFKEALEATVQRKIWSHLFKMVDNTIQWIIEEGFNQMDYDLTAG